MKIEFDESRLKRAINGIKTMPLEMLRGLADTTWNISTANSYCSITAESRYYGGTNYVKIYLTDDNNRTTEINSAQLNSQKDSINKSTYNSFIKRALTKLESLLKTKSL